MNETKIIEGDYNNEDEVVIEIVKSIPQPDKVETETTNVEEIKKTIAKLQEEISGNLLEMKILEDILSDNKKEIKDVVKKDE